MSEKFEREYLAEYVDGSVSHGTELKPCPFCADAIECAEYPWRGEYKPKLKDFDGFGFAVVCNYCNAQGPSSGDEIDAIDWWNQRDLYEKKLDKPAEVC